MAQARVATTWARESASQGGELTFSFNWKAGNTPRREGTAGGRSLRRPWEGPLAHEFPIPHAWGTPIHKECVQAGLMEPHKSFGHNDRTLTSQAKPTRRHV